MENFVQCGKRLTAHRLSCTMNITTRTGLGPAQAQIHRRGRSALCAVQKMEETAIQPADQTVFISHGDCLADAEYVANRVREKFGVKNIYINFIGPVIGAHSGPGTVALFFIGEHR